MNSHTVLMLSFIEYLTLASVTYMVGIGCLGACSTWFILLLYSILAAWGMGKNKKGIIKVGKKQREEEAKG